MHKQIPVEEMHISRAVQAVLIASELYSLFTKAFSFNERSTYPWRREIKRKKDGQDKEKVKSKRRLSIETHTYA
jgi:hypothetical protein